jgi:hypothetical protein
MKNGKSWPEILDKLENIEDLENNKDRLCV